MVKKILRNKFKTFLRTSAPSVFVFLLAFSLSPPRGFSNSNNLMFYMGGTDGAGYHLHLWSYAEAISFCGGL
jgi:hypothetical protein